MMAAGPRPRNRSRRLLAVQLSRYATGRRLVSRPCAPAGLPRGQTMADFRLLLLPSIKHDQIDAPHEFRLRGLEG